MITNIITPAVPIPKSEREFGYAGIKGAIKKRDSAQYKRGYQMGLKRSKPTAKSHPYGETEFEKMGRWEGQNTKIKK